MVASGLDPLDYGGAVGRISFLIAVASLAVAVARLLHPKRGVLLGYTRGRQRRTFKRLQRLWYPLVVVYPLALGLLSLMGYLYSAGVLTELLLKTVWIVVDLVMFAAMAERWLLVTRRRLAFDAAMERQQAAAQGRSTEAVSSAGEPGSPFEAEEPEVALVTLSDRSRKLVPNKEFITGRLLNWSLSG